jgi:hypothetical protein
MEKKVIQISIKELVLDKRGPMDGEEDYNLIRFTLSYPSEGISGIETLKTIKSTKPIPVNWGQELDKSIVFKTNIRGKSVLSIEAVSVDKSSATEKAFKRLFKSLFGAVLGVWTGGFGSAYVGAITNTVGTTLVDLAEDEDDIDVIGVAEVILDSENLNELVELDLNVKKPVVEKTYVTRGSGERSNRRRRVIETTIIPEGINGHVKLLIQEL